jgi:hypothetical protein
MRAANSSVSKPRGLDTAQTGFDTAQTPTQPTATQPTGMRGADGFRYGADAYSTHGYSTNTLSQQLSMFIRVIRERFPSHLCHVGDVTYGLGMCR